MRNLGNGLVQLKNTLYHTTRLLGNKDLEKKRSRGGGGNKRQSDATIFGLELSHGVVGMM